MSTVDDFPIAYLITRIHDYVRRENPLEYLQTVGSTKYDLGVSASLESFDFHVYSPRSSYGYGHLHVRVRTLPALSRTVLMVEKDGSVDVDADQKALLLDKLLPMLEQALVLDDLSSI